MNRQINRLGQAVLLGMLALFLSFPSAIQIFAEKIEDNEEVSERLVDYPKVSSIKQLDRKIQEIAERQEQIMRRFDMLSERLGPMPQPPLPENLNRPQPQSPVQALVPLFTRALHEAKGIIKLCFFMGMIINILLAIWIFLDIRKRGEGSGIFIALALIAGVPAAIIYTLSRIADKKTGASS
jgi:hypothetical protein